MPESDPHDEIERLEAQIDELADRLESCRKFIVAARIAAAAGAILLAAMAIDAIRIDLGAMAAAMAALLGGIVVWGANGSTAKEASAEMAAAEARRVALIEQLDLHTIAEAKTRH